MFEWHMGWWDEQGSVDWLVTPAVQKSLTAYASKQAHIWWSLGLTFDKMWQSSDELIQLGVTTTFLTWVLLLPLTSSTFPQKIHLLHWMITHWHRATAISYMLFLHLLIIFLLSRWRYLLGCDNSICLAFMAIIYIIFIHNVCTTTLLGRCREHPPGSVSVKLVPVGFGHFSVFMATVLAATSEHDCDVLQYCGW